MKKNELIEAIKNICDKKNDIRIDQTVKGEGWSFDAKYIFLGEKGLYVTDTLYIIGIGEIDTESLNRIYQEIVSK